MRISELVGMIEQNMFLSPYHTLYFLDKSLPLDIIWKAYEKKVKNKDSINWPHLREITRYIIINAPDLAEKLFVEHMYDEHIALLFAPSSDYAINKADFLEECINEFFTSMVNKHYKQKVDALDFYILYFTNSNFFPFLNPYVFFKQIFKDKMILKQKLFKKNFETDYEKLKKTTIVILDSNNQNNKNTQVFDINPAFVNSKKYLSGKITIDKNISFQFVSGDSSELKSLNKKYAFSNPVKIYEFTNKTNDRLLKILK